MAKAVAFYGLLELAVGIGDTIPSPIDGHPIVWSTTLSKPLIWNGTGYEAISGGSSLPSDATQASTGSVSIASESANGVDKVAGYFLYGKTEETGSGVTENALAVSRVFAGKGDEEVRMENSFLLNPTTVEGISRLEILPAGAETSPAVTTKVELVGGVSVASISLEGDSVAINLPTAVGGILSSQTANKLEVLPVGSLGQVLTVGATNLLEWAAPSSGGFPAVATQSASDAVSITSEAASGEVLNSYSFLATLGESNSSLSVEYDNASLLLAGVNNQKVSLDVPGSGGADSSTLESQQLVRYQVPGVSEYFVDTTVYENAADELAISQVSKSLSYSDGTISNSLNISKNYIVGDDGAGYQMGLSDEINLTYTSGATTYSASQSTSITLTAASQTIVQGVQLAAANASFENRIESGDSIARLNLIGDSVELNISSTIGDTLVCTAANTFTKLPVGAEDQVLTVGAAGAVAWETPLITSDSVRIAKNSKDITGATTVAGFAGNNVIKSDVTSLARIFHSFPTTEAASFTLTDLIHFSADIDTLGAGSVITNQYGFHASASLITSSVKYGFYGALTSGNNRWNFYGAGNAPSYLAGDLRTNACLSEAAVPSTALTADATLTVAALRNTLVIANPAAAINLTLPTGTNSEGGQAQLQVNQMYRWSVINTNGTNSTTLVANTAHTVVGNMVVPPSTSAEFGTRKTATNTYITYRLS